MKTKYVVIFSLIRNMS